jgi:electron transfer flavoprotein alpha subunit
VDGRQSWRLPCWTASKQRWEVDAVDVLVFAERLDGSLEPAFHQVIRSARGLAGSGRVSALVLGPPGSAAVEQTRTSGIDRVYAVLDSRLAEYSPEAYGKVCAKAVQALRPDAFLCAHTFQGMDIGPYVAASLGFPLLSNCFDLEVSGEELSAERKVFGSAWQTRVAVSLAPTVVATLARRSGGEATHAAPAPVEEIHIDLDTLGIRTRTAGTAVADAGEGDITRAAVVVAVGRGIRDPSNLGMIEELARALGGVVACSRPLVDLEWMPHSRQVGASGHEIAPRVYVACGISGAAQHLAGIRGAQTIIAINKDPKAPIFGLSDYAVVADLFEVVPALTEQARGRRAPPDDGNG